MFDSENDQGSDLVQEPFLDDEIDEGGLKILEQNGTALELEDMEDLNSTPDAPMDIGASDYDVLP
jgi:hypothetical protein